jgi:antitoxin (DNA-binding transcriptional repressor) of toxin-antitoxin stability system
MSGILPDMTRVSVRQFHRDSRFERLAAAGEEVLVTRNGKPYYRVLPAPAPRTFLGGAQTGRPLTARFLGPAADPLEWEATR